jgi:hypothetical protein
MLSVFNLLLLRQLNGVVLLDQHSVHVVDSLDKFDNLAGIVFVVKVEYFG